MTSPVVERLRAEIEAFPTGTPLVSPLSILMHMDVFGGEEEGGEPWAELVRGGRYAQVYAVPVWPWLIVSVIVAALLLKLVRSHRSGA